MALYAKIEVVPPVLIDLRVQMVHIISTTTSFVGLADVWIEVKHLLKNKLDSFPG